DAAVLPVKHSRLTIGRRRGQSAKPSSEREPFAQQPRNRRTEPELERPTQIGVSQRVDLQHDQAPLRRTRPFFAREWPVLGAIVPSQQRTGSRTRSAFDYARRCSIRRRSSPIGTGLSRTSAQPPS